LICISLLQHQADLPHSMLCTPILSFDELQPELATKVPARRDLFTQPKWP